MNTNNIRLMLNKYDRIIFNNEINNSEVILTLQRTNCNSFLGSFTGYIMGGYPFGLILLNKKLNKIDSIKDVLVHEMVHCIQAIRGYEIDHGEFFKSERARINKHFNINI